MLTGKKSVKAGMYVVHLKGCLKCLYLFIYFKKMLYRERETAHNLKEKKKTGELQR
jgi:hypothetical protein